LSQWSTNRSANGSPIWGPALLNKAPNTANRDSLFNNAEADTFITGQTDGVIGLKPTEVGANNIIGVDVTAPGTGFTARPTISFSGGGGTGVAANAAAKAVAVALNGPGTGGSYIPGETLSVTGGTGTAVAVSVTATEIRTVAIAVAGNGYSNGDVVTLNTGSGTAATFTVTTGAADQIPASLALTTRGTYTTNPTLTSVGTTSANTAQANGLVVNVTTRIKTISTLDAGEYTVLPTLTGAATSGSATGTGATLNLTMGVGRVWMTNTGTGYTSAPTVSFGGAGGSGATGTAIISLGGDHASPGWIKRTVGSGGRAGRVQTEVLVVSKSITD
jgi:hypothetical protein